MAADKYYASHHIVRDQQHLLSPSLSSPGYPSAHSSGQSSPLKPLHVTMDMEHKKHNQHRASLVDFDGLRQAHDQDAKLKARIRRLRMISRVLATLISVGVFVPLALTLRKFLSTQNIYRDVKKSDGSIVNRTAWAKDSKVWPTWMYFLVSGVSVVLNFVILLAYKCGGVEKANKAAALASWFTWSVLLGNLLVWCVAAGLYRSEKDKDGKSNDLWGWTCSPAAKVIQKDFAGEVDFNQYCNVQSASFYIGLVQVAAAMLTVLTYVFVLMRKGTKKNLKRHSQMAGQYPTNY